MQFIILHGSFGNQSENWFPWLKKQLEKDGHSVIAENFPIEDWDAMEEAGRGNWAVKNQNLSRWSIYYQNHILTKLDKNVPTCVIAHSLAPMFLLSMLPEDETEFELGVFVAPFFEQMRYDDWRVEAVNFPFQEKKFNWKKIRSKLNKSYVLHSDNDPYVDAKYSIEFARNLEADVIAYKGAGHFNTAAGWNKAPIILELCRSVYADHS